MMAVLLFLIVFIMSYTGGKARPLIDSDFNILSRNGLEQYISNDMIFRMPTTIKPDTSIQINGILNTSNKMFRVTLGGEDENTEDCKIMVNFDTNIISVTPAIEDYESESYDVHLQDGEESTFSLRVIARETNGKEMLGINFQVNEEGESPHLICDIKSFERISRIVMQEGITRVDSLNFDFNINR